MCGSEGGLPARWWRDPSRRELLPRMAHMDAPQTRGDGRRPAPRTFTREQLERELAIVEELERRKAAAAAPRLGNE